MKIFKKIISVAVIASTVMFSTYSIGFADEDASKDMTLYAFYIKPNKGEEPEPGGEAEFGDAVLMESNGKYLLMDAAAAKASDSVVKALKSRGVEHLSVYVSHYHPDHFEGIAAIVDAGITIDKLYLPDRELGGDWESPNGGTTYNQCSKILGWTGFDANNEDEVQFLKKGSTFSIGDVDAEVLGPVGEYDRTEFNNYFPSNVYGERDGHYLNNYCLTTMFTCGKIKYLTTGDIESIEYQRNIKEGQTTYGKKGGKVTALEEENLVAEYGKALKADILKMAHHGLKSSNSSKFIKAVAPRIAFADNTGYQELVKADGGVKAHKYHTPVENMQKYGFSYMTGEEEAGLGIVVKDDKITAYRDGDNDLHLEDSEKLQGWVYVWGIKSVKLSDADKKAGYKKDYTGKDIYYISKTSDFKPKTGIQQITVSGEKRTYCFTDGGAMETGLFSKGEGQTYSHWRNYTVDGKTKQKYFSKLDSKGRATMAYGFTKIDGNYFYFVKSTGFRYIPSKGDSNSPSKMWKLKKIGSYYYLFKKGTGFVYNKGRSKTVFMKFGKKYRAFDKKGRMLTGKKKVNGKYYTFDKKTGYRK